MFGSYPSSEIAFDYSQQKGCCSQPLQITSLVQAQSQKVFKLSKLEQLEHSHVFFFVFFYKKL